MSTRSPNRRITRTPALVHAVIFVLVAMLGAAQAAHAAGPERRAYDIPSGALSQALVQFAAAAGVMLSSDARLTDGKHSPGLRGEFSVEEGLASLLAGSGLAQVLNADGSYTLRPLNDPLDALMREARRPLKLAEAAAAPQKTSESGTGDLPEMTVTAKGWDETSYTVPVATTATKTDTPIMETPFSIKAVPQQVLQDQQVFRIEKALQNVSGVVRHPSNQGRSEQYTIRGFSNGQSVGEYYRDGFSFPFQFGARDTTNLERVEVLKGPGSILYGRAEPGGIINLVTKQPLSAPLYSLQQQFGSFDFYRTTVDTTGPITGDGTLLYRFNLGYENAGSFKDFLDNERVFDAPTLRWNISDRTQVNLELEYLHSNAGSDPGVPNIGNRPAPLPRETNLGEPFANTEIDSVLVGLNWSHALNKRWTIRHRFNTYLLDQRSLGFFFDGAMAPNGTINRGAFDEHQTTETYYTTLDLTGKVSTGNIKHNILIGGDYFREDFEADDLFGSVPSINIFRPAYLNDADQLPPLTPFAFNSTTYWYGLYLQDQIELPYDLHALASFRYDEAHSDGTDEFLGAALSR